MSSSIPFFLRRIISHIFCLPAIVPGEQGRLNVIKVIRAYLESLATLFTDPGRDLGLIFPVPAGDERNLRKRIARSPAVLIF